MASNRCVGLRGFGDEVARLLRLALPFCLCCLEFGMPGKVRSSCGDSPADASPPFRADARTDHVFNKILEHSGSASRASPRVMQHSYTAAEHEEWACIV